MTTTLTASTASNSCTLAIHARKVWAVPVKSKKSHVMPKIITVARMILIFLKVIK